MQIKNIYTVFECSLNFCPLADGTVLFRLWGDAFQLQHGKSRNVQEFSLVSLAQGCQTDFM